MGVSGDGCPLMGQSGHPELHCACPLLGVKRTSPELVAISAFDPRRTKQPKSGYLRPQRSVCDLHHCLARPWLLKTAVKFTHANGVQHENADLDCDGRSGSCEHQWTQRGCRRGSAVSGCRVPYHPASDVGVETVGRNQRAATPQCATRYGCGEGAGHRSSRFRHSQPALSQHRFVDILAGSSGSNKADIAQTCRHVRLWPLADMR
jgi:hypothetical protein